MIWRKLRSYAFQLSLLVYVGLPIVVLIMMSFSRSWRWPDLFPAMWSLQAWSYVFSSYAHTWSALFISLWIACVVTGLNLLVAIPAAEVLARRQISGKLAIEALLLAPIVVSPMVSIMGLHVVFISLGLTDSLIGVMLAHVIPTFPYMLRSLMISYGTLGFQWEEQARVLGASKWKRWIEVVFPHILPGIAMGIGLSMLVSLSQYVLTFLIGGGQVMTIPLLMFPYVNQGDPAIAATYSVLFMGIALIALYGSGLLLKVYYRRDFSLGERR